MDTMLVILPHLYTFAILECLLIALLLFSLIKWLIKKQYK